MNMNCKYCNAELDEDISVCPVCGKVQTEVENVASEMAEEAAVETDAVEVPAEEVEVPAEEVEVPEAEEEELKPGKSKSARVATSVVAIVLLLAILIGLFVGTMGGAKNAQPSETMPAAETAEPVQIPSDGDPASAMCKATYTVSDADAAAARETVVATMGDKVLTNGELQAYYWMEVSLFLQEYGSYANYIGLDLNTPFDQQVTEMGEKAMSWQQFFLDSAIYTWKTYQSMELESEAVGFEMPAERREGAGRAGSPA